MTPKSMPVPRLFLPYRTVTVPMTVSLPLSLLRKNTKKNNTKRTPHDIGSQCGADKAYFPHRIFHNADTRKGGPRGAPARALARDTGDHGGRIPGTPRDGGRDAMAGNGKPHGREAAGPAPGGEMHASRGRKCTPRVCIRYSLRSCLFHVTRARHKKIRYSLRSCHCGRARVGGTRWQKKRPPHGRPLLSD